MKGLTGSFYSLVAAARAGENVVIDVRHISKASTPSQKKAEDKEGAYEISAFIDGAVYEAGHRHIWSIGVDKAGRIFAAIDGRFYQNADFVCLWLR